MTEFEKHAFVILKALDLRLEIDLNRLGILQDAPDSIKEAFEYFSSMPQRKVLS